METETKKALVCGAGGFIGSHMVKKLKSLGWEPKISLREGLESTYEWMKNNRSNLRIYNRSELDYGN